MSQNQKVAQTIEGTPVIVLTGGGTGGHITPILSLAHALKQKNPDCNIVYIGHKGDKFDTLHEGYHDFDFVSFVNAGKFRRYHGESKWRQLTDVKTLFFNIRDFFRLINSIGKALRILGRVKPAVVFSKGGFVAVPVGIAAKLRAIPIVTHDSDALPGLANRTIGRWATIHATGMPAEFYDYPRSSVRYVGIPLNTHVKKVDKISRDKFKRQLGIPADSLLLMIAGGSLGSQSINEKILELAPEVLSVSPKLYIVHIAGQRNDENIKQRYGKLLNPELKKRIMVLSFTNEFYKYSGAADLIITRAGATVLAEFALQAKACIVIPSPFLTGGHQLKNAEELKKIGAVEVLSEDVSSEQLLGKIIKLLAEPRRRTELEEKLGKTAKANAAAELADILLEVAKTQK